MNVLLQNCPAQLKAVLLNSNGIAKSRISYFDSAGKFKLRSPSVLSIATTLLSGDDSFETELTDSVQSDIEKWINESKLSVGNVPYCAKTKEEIGETLLNDSDSFSNITICDNYISSNQSESIVENLDKLLLSETSSEKSEPLSRPDNRVILLFSNF